MLESIYSAWNIGYIQILLIAGAIERSIVQFSEAGSSFINNTKILPCICADDHLTTKQPVHIMWTGSALNHVVPIVPGSCK